MVDLPEPDGPMIAVNWPAWKFAEISSSARTAAAPVPWTFTPLTMRAADATSIVKVACSLRMVMFIGPAFLATVPTEPRQVPALSCLCPHRPGHRIITTRPPINWRSRNASNVS